MPADFLLNDDGDQFIVDELVLDALVLEEDGVTEIELEEGGGSIEAVIVGPGSDFLLIDGGVYNLGLSDSVALSDSWSRTHNAVRTPADAVAVSDFFLYGWDEIQPIADTVAVTDALAIAQGQKLGPDVVGLSDSRTFDVGKKVADVVLARDGALVIQWGDGTDHKMLIDTEAVSVTDAVRIQFGVPRQFTQVPIEVLLEPVSKAQWTQTPVEVLVYLSPMGQWTQLPWEVLVSPANPDAQITQVAYEVLRRQSYETFEIVYID